MTEEKKRTFGKDTYQYKALELMVTIMEGMTEKEKNLLDSWDISKFMPGFVHICTSLTDDEAAMLYDNLQVVFHSVLAPEGEPDVTLLRMFTLIHYLYSAEETQRFWKLPENRPIRKYMAHNVIYQLEHWNQQEQQNPFVEISQNKVTNVLPKALSVLQPTLTGEEAVSKIGKGTGEITFTLTNADKYGLLETVDLMLLRSLQWKMKASPGEMTCLPIREYAEMRGRSLSKESLQNVRKEAVASLNRLANVTYSYKEKVNNRWVPSGGVRINGGTFIVRNGIIYWNWNPVFAEQLTRLAPMQFALEGLKTDPRTPAFYFSDKIDQHFRMNEGKENEDVISVATLLDGAPNIQTIDEVRKTRQSPKRRIITPFFNYLDALPRLYYVVLNEDGEIIDPDEIKDYADFIKCKIRFDVDLAKYERNPERVKAKARRAAKNREKKQTKSKENASGKQ